MIFLTTRQENDPTNGFVDYQSESAATTGDWGGGKALAFTDPATNETYLGVDYKNTIPSGQRGRPSVRLESVKTYTYGLFIVDLTHMPGSICGTWPAFVR